MKKILILLMLIGILHAEEDVRKVVFDLTTSDLQTFEQKVLKGIAVHKAHYEGNLKELEVAVVIHGGAYRFFLKDPANSVYKEDKALIAAQPELAKRIASMSETYEVTFLMCHSGMVKNKIEKKDVYPFVEIVPNAAIGLIDKQAEGYGYIPIGN